MSGIVEHFLAGTQFHHLTAVKHRDPVGHIGHNAQVMGDEDDGVAEFLLQILDQLQDLRLNGHVQSSGRLVADQNFRLAGQGDGDNDTLAHTAGILEGVIVEPGLRIGNAHLLHQHQGALSRLQLRTVLVLEDNGGDLLADGDDGVQGGHGILEHGCDLAAADLRPVLGIPDLGQVDDAGAVEHILGLVQVFDPEDHLVEHGIAHLVAA